LPYFFFFFFFFSLDLKAHSACVLFIKQTMAQYLNNKK
jgi:hypothetical protein